MRRKRERVKKNKNKYKTFFAFEEVENERKKHSDK